VVNSPTNTDTATGIITTVARPVEDEPKTQYKNPGLQKVSEKLGEGS